MVMRSHQLIDGVLLHQSNVISGMYLHYYFELIMALCLQPQIEKWQCAIIDEDG